MDTPLQDCKIIKEEALDESTIIIFSDEFINTNENYKIDPDPLAIKLESPAELTETQDQTSKPSKLWIPYEFISIKTEPSFENHNYSKDEASKCLCKLKCSIESKLHAQFRQAKLFKCKQCDYQDHYKCNVKKHVRSHHAETPIQCKFCNFKSIYKKSLQKHMKNHNRASAKPFDCHFCDYKSPYTYNLREHLKTHSEYRPFQCEQCGLRFIQKYEFSKHMKQTHQTSS